MADVVDSAKRSSMMAGIRGQNTKPERKIRSILHRMGYRFRLHVSNLPGRPDLVLPKYEAVILIHGCFWHRHAGCKYATTPASNREFWLQKFDQNTSRDRRNHELLQNAGWRVGMIWECEVRRMPVHEIGLLISDWLKGSDSLLELPTLDYVSHLNIVQDV